MPPRAAKPCRMMWIWAIGGTVLGFATALIGREAILACTEAVETTVHRHLDDQIVWTADRDPEMSSVIASIKDEEQAHIHYAIAHREGRGYGWLERLISVATESLIWISTRGDSARLAAELRNA